MAANTLISESTFTGPQFQTLYITSMPYPRASGSPFFKGVNVSKFLEKFNNIYDDYQMSALEKICRLPWYCEIFIAWYVRSVIGFSKLN